MNRTILIYQHNGAQLQIEANEFAMKWVRAQAIADPMTKSFTLYDSTPPYEWRKLEQMGYLDLKALRQA